MNRHPATRLSAFFQADPSVWGNLEAYIRESKESNRDHRSYSAAKFVKLYTDSLDLIIHNETSTDEEKSVAKTLKTSNVKGENQIALVRTEETLSKNHQMLHEFVFDRLSQTEQLSKLSEYEVYVALSGIINARMRNANKYFDEEILNTIKVQCLRDDFHRPEHVLGLSEILDKLKGLADRFISLRGVVDYKGGLSDEVTCLKAKHIKKTKKNKATLRDPIWTALLDTIDYLGELPSRATKHQSAYLGLELDIEMSKGSGGKRLDLQCRAGNMELNNCEFKRCDTAQGKLEQQFPKNVLINHSMMLYLKEKIGFPLDKYELQALDVHENVRHPTAMETKAPIHLKVVSTFNSKLHLCYYQEHLLPTENSLELAIVADANVIADDFMSLRLEGVTVTEDVFCAFMVDDPDGIDNSGRRINELSALLSRNGISIFYLSTRITDFILVKEKRLKSVLPTIRSIFSLSVDSDCDLSSNISHGEFNSGSEQGSYPGSSFTSMNSFLHTPSSPSRYQHNQHNQYPNHNDSYTSVYQNSSYQHNQQQEPYHGTNFSSSYKPSSGISIPFGRQPSYGNFAAPRRGFFSTSGRLHSDSDSSSIDNINGGPGPGGEAGQGMISSSHSRSQLSMRYQHRRQSSTADSSFGERIGRYFHRRYPHGSSYDSFDGILGPVSDGKDENEAPQLYVRTSLFQAKDTRRGSESFIFPPLTPSGGSFPGLGSLPSFGLILETQEEQEDRETRIKEQMRKSCPRSVIDDRLILASLAPEDQAEWAVTLLKVLFYPEQLPGFSSSKSRFISFTTTDEGTSLIADEEVLSHFEEHMLNQSPSETMLRCIQVDLSTFGLDTYGLVYSMSNPLVDHGVNLLCLSTLRTANVLVHDSDLDKSLKILSIS
ncbi:GATS protein-like 3 [Modicella reniformis]|uniref:GATS protein-like 3 n=1 Tax=Modicella reniformis TaxID=1440133 RepID=A0A9P6SUD1_9FUNG|nr:GATS protein-like 3 [Modicella reniformis]